MPEPVTVYTSNDVLKDENYMRLYFVYKKDHAREKNIWQTSLDK